MIDVEHDRPKTLSDLADLLTPWAIRVAATLRLPELVDEGVTTVSELAARVSADEVALTRLLRLLVCRGVFVESSTGILALTDVSREMMGGAARRWLDLDGAGGRMETAYSGLLESIRTGEAAYPKAFGCSVWRDFESSPRLSESFGAYLAELAGEWGPELAERRDWSGVSKVVDVGGGDGTLISTLLRGHPTMCGVLVDLPATALAARQRLAETGVADRATVVEGSFFERLPEGGDLYILAQVLHDWPDTEATAILRRCAEAAGPGGRLLVIERVRADESPDDVVDAALAAMDLRMLLLFGSMERSADEFARLAADAGLSLRTRDRVGELGLLEFVVEPVAVECGRESRLSAATAAN
ncbi:ubiquinone/menaquinone biosynthesis C-methylase UbiE [Actinoalloteichus hoggarensis]|uniref:Carminomycin 4-O-methyltransferase n=1 Tax=Actinoalloteichus hoggarensis TaxID=1470176 RepID=A0A221VZD3_9PSEU|nr:methyltransferase [Actinoalloteichus hoggarensis]ASO18897.1 Carminomycin 4-O-methyltransferase [Actinoalloteichus hoggarensis]MBB5920132.1 ubiquinone/menaquinone biosynthesis C-methylase UbiE [Actinoalloteichus hoggarensis]